LFSFKNKKILLLCVFMDDFSPQRRNVCFPNRKKNYLMSVLNAISSKEAIELEHKFGAHNYHPLPQLIKGIAIQKS